jgi:O-antigen/teichoic acid export membrane protein
MLDKEKPSFLEGQFKNLRITSIFLFPLVTFLAFRAQDIIPFFFGEASKIMVFPFQIIIWSVIFIYYNYLFLRMALFINRTEIIFSSVAILALYAIVLNFCLIPRYGIEGICIATVVSLAVMFIFTAFYITKVGIRIPLYKSAEKPAIATMGLTLVLHYLDSWSFPLILLSSFVSYFLILIILSTLEKECSGKAKKLSK